MKQHELPMLAGIAGIIRWVEELANLVSGPLLTLGLGIALVDLLTDGSLLARVPALLYAWAITQAIGVDAQLVAMWDKAHNALRERRYWALFGLVALGLVLAYVAWIAAQVFALQESEGLTEQAALARLGLDSSIWLVQRTALSVFLVCLAGWTRYHAPAQDVASDAEAERARLEADLMLEPLRQQKRILQARGMRGVLAASVGRGANLANDADHVHSLPVTPVRSAIRSRSIRASDIEQETRSADSEAGDPESVSDGRRHETPLTPPTGPGLPSAASKRRATGTNRSGSSRVVPIRSGNAEDRIRTEVMEHPNVSVRALARRAGVSESTASKWLTVIRSEQTQAVR